MRNQNPSANSFNIPLQWRKREADAALTPSFFLSFFLSVCDRPRALVQVLISRTDIDSLSSLYTFETCPTAKEKEGENETAAFDPADSS